MMRINNKMILGIMITIFILLGAVANPVAALQTNMLEETFKYGFEPGVNNHTYIYVPATSPAWTPSLESTYFNEDTDLARYNYNSGGWIRDDTSYDEASTNPWNWQTTNTLPGYTHGDAAYLPQFYDFIGSDGSGAIINTTLERRSFSLNFGQQTAIAVESDYEYYGTLPISGQEFVHLTVASLQDGYSWTITVYDPQGRRMATGTYSNGNIIVLPFRPSITGTYIVRVHSAASEGERVLFTLLPQAITPQLISPNEVVTDSLPTSELRLSADNGIIYDELAPTARTYKINPGEDVSSLTYEFNYPVPIFGYTQGVVMTLTNDAFTHGVNGGYRYQDSTSYPDNGVYYCSDGVNYITLVGGDNIEYSLYHETDVASELIVNEPFRVDNIFGHEMTNVYSLSVPEDSVLMLNTTSTGDFDQYVHGILDSGYRYAFDLDDGSTFLTSGIYYLPAGEYIIEVYVQGHVSERMQFTFHPLSTDTSAGIITTGGFIVPTEPGHEYNLSITLDNLYNVSVPMWVGIYSSHFWQYHAFFTTLGTWFDGSSQIPHSTYENTVDYDASNRQWTDHAIILFGVYPYNNTVGVGNDYANFTVDLTIDWEDVTHDNYVEVASIDTTTGADSYNFTLDASGETSELYSLFVNATIGTWYNVSITSNEVNSFTAVSYVEYAGRTHRTPWSDLDDELQGSSPDWSFQFGAISSGVYLEFTLDRNLADGHFSVEITPLPTHQFELPEALTPGGPDLLAILGGLALPIGIGAVVIVVVAVVYVKKYR